MPREQFFWQFLQVCHLDAVPRSNAAIFQDMQITLCAWNDVDKEDNRPEDLQAAAELGS
ncbi:hypothetical protein F5Y07DRAFT_404967 [Xylaria sp. FL0933]|nr:hypothetical protein F5Y07DRAFT_404967 [Xylaria sp. FL0933]